ncbi:hypothetical protein TNCV_4584901 [Trichonephila clavipes]|nr:hypothetical protein TNCV_4584901 [Trichonephila clavipes]
MSVEHLSDCPTLLHVLSQDNCGDLLPARATSALYWTVRCLMSERTLVGIISKKNYSNEFLNRVNRKSCMVLNGLKTIGNLCACTPPQHSLCFSKRKADQLQAPTRTDVMPNVVCKLSDSSRILDQCQEDLDKVYRDQQR